jgi:hypothetical protein
MCQSRIEIRWNGSKRRNLRGMGVKPILNRVEQKKKRGCRIVRSLYTAVRLEQVGLKWKKRGEGIEWIM